MEAWISPSKLKIFNLGWKGPPLGFQAPRPPMLPESNVPPSEGAWGEEWERAPQRGLGTHSWSSTQHTNLTWGLLMEGAVLRFLPLSGSQFAEETYP